jgi:hypothetical protein
MVNDFFPFRLYSSSDHGHSPSGFGKAFQANRPEYIERVESKGTKFEWTRQEKFSYYCYDVIIFSQTEVEFVCFDMYDNYYGGKGKEIHRFRATVNKSVTNEYVGRRLFARGVDRRERELAEAEKKLCRKYANEERKALGIDFND